MALELSSADFADLMTQTVSIERSGDPLRVDAAGGPSPVVEPDEAAVPCLILPQPARYVLAGDREVAVAVVRIYFDRVIRLGPTDRVVYADPARGGAERRWRPEPSRNLAEVGAITVVDCEEVG